MAHERPKLSAEPRQKLGTKYSRRVRRTGKLPAVIYGHGIAPAHVIVDAEQINDALHGGAHLLDIDVAGKNETCLIKAIQFNYLGDDVIHVDLARVDLSEEVTVSVPLSFIGRDQCVALAASGTLLQHPLSDLQVICRADSIPDEIEVDIAGLTLEAPITVADLKLPEGVRADTDEDTIVAMLTQVTEEDIEKLAEAPAAGGAEPEVITAKKEEPAADAAKGGEKEKK